jgi:hypothetical protein
MTSTLFDLGPEPTERDTAPPCEHPHESQFLNRSLFSGAFDMVCSDCGATIAADYQLGVTL